MPIREYPSTTDVFLSQLRVADGGHLACFTDLVKEQAVIQFGSSVHIVHDSDPVVTETDFCFELFDKKIKDGTPQVVDTVAFGLLRLNDVAVVASMACQWYEPDYDADIQERPDAASIVTFFDVSALARGTSFARSLIKSTAGLDQASENMRRFRDHVEPLWDPGIVARIGKDRRDSKMWQLEIPAINRVVQATDVSQVSLGETVSSAVALHFAQGGHRLALEENSSRLSHGVDVQIEMNTDRPPESIAYQSALLRLSGLEPMSSLN